MWSFIGLQMKKKKPFTLQDKMESFGCAPAIVEWDDDSHHYPGDLPVNISPHPPATYCFENL